MLGINEKSPDMTFRQIPFDAFPKRCDVNKET